MKITAAVFGFLMLLFYPAALTGAETQTPSPGPAGSETTSTTTQASTDKPAAPLPPSASPATGSGTTPGNETTASAITDAPSKSPTTTPRSTSNLSPSSVSTSPGATPNTPAPTASPKSTTPSVTPSTRTTNTTTGAPSSEATDAPTPPGPQNTTTSTPTPTTPTPSPSSSGTTQNKTETSSVPQASTSSAGTKTPSTPAATTGPSVKPPTSAPTTATTALPVIVTISETNLLLADSNFFVELRGAPGVSLKGVTLVVYNTSNKDSDADSKLEMKQFVDGDKFGENGLFIQKLKNETGKGLQTALVVAYNPGTNITGAPKKEGMIDFILVSASPAAAQAIAPVYRETFGIGDKPVTIINKQKLGNININNNVSLSRCGPQNTLILSTATKNDANNCNFKTENNRNVEFAVWTDTCITSDLEKIKEQLLNKLVEKINSICQCGLTSSLLKNPMWTTRDSCSTGFKNFTLSTQFQSVFPSQSTLFRETLTAFVSSETKLSVGDKSFNVVNCTYACLPKAPPHHQTKDNSNISVTVGVVLSCIAVFLVILVAIVIYMRRKRRGILQFRMTRLAEDDDLEDMEDFVGGPIEDHEPSFNNSQYNLTS